MALSFKWSVRKDGSFIEWEAKWDGQWENDPLVNEHTFLHEDTDDRPSDRKNPFNATFEYELQLKDFKNPPDLSKFNSPILNVEDFVWEDPFVAMTEYGDICANNPATRGLCEMIQLSVDDPEEFRGLSGWTDSYFYRGNLLKALVLFWD